MSHNQSNLGHRILGALLGVVLAFAALLLLWDGLKWLWHYIQ